MILLVHMLLGAAVGSIISNPILAVVLALLSHYFLDLIPHVEYHIEYIVKRQWPKAWLNVFEIALDFCLGTLLVLMFSRQPLVLICAMVSVLPDLVTALNYFLPNKIINAINTIHTKKIHFLAADIWKGKKISMFWRIATQVTIVIISIALLKI